MLLSTLRPLLPLHKYAIKHDALLYHEPWISKNREEHVVKNIHTAVAASALLMLLSAPCCLCSRLTFVLALAFVAALLLVLAFASVADGRAPVYWRCGIIVLQVTARAAIRTPSPAGLTTAARATVASSGRHHRLPQKRCLPCGFADSSCMCDAQALRDDGNVVRQLRTHAAKKPLCRYAPWWWRRCRRPRCRRWWPLRRRAAAAASAAAAEAHLAAVSAAAAAVDATVAAGVAGVAAVAAPAAAAAAAAAATAAPSAATPTAAPGVCCCCCCCC